MLCSTWGTKKKGSQSARRCCQVLFCGVCCSSPVFLSSFSNQYRGARWRPLSLLGIRRSSSYALKMRRGGWLPWEPMAHFPHHLTGPEI